MATQPINKLELPAEVADVLNGCKGFTVANKVKELADSACPIEGEHWYDVSFDIPGKGKVSEAHVCRVKNGIAANYPEPYMRRRDPNCMYIGDDLPTDKPRFDENFDKPFADIKQETFDWLKSQELAVFAFPVGTGMVEVDAIAIAPKNVGFFSLGLALLQGIHNLEEVEKTIKPKCILYVAPTFRHTHFDEKQVVVHDRADDLYEIFSYNLYPGPSAKKGIYGALIHFGEKENWITAHASSVKVVTPYGNKLTIMHEGASGGGKSEMLEHVHREKEGNLLLGENLVTGEKSYMVMPQTCSLHPISDDMALCHPTVQKDDGKLHISDAEDSWFIRVNHIVKYGTDPEIEARSIYPTGQLLFLNIDAKPGGTALLWDHIMDTPEKPCPNPRFVLPRRSVPKVVDKPASIDIRSFGVRCPACKKDDPTYGIIGLFHLLNPALAWLWRLVSPRGFDNPSIVQTDVMSSEGVGSYWPFSSGKMVTQANLLLKQIKETPNVHYTLCPNQNIGAWNVKFMPQWIMREFLARRGGAWFTPEQVVESRCPILGYSLRKIVVEGQEIDEGFLRTYKQPEIGEDTYDKGAKMLTDFFKQELKQYMEMDELDPLGKEIIQAAFDDAPLKKYDELIKGAPFIVEDE